MMGIFFVSAFCGWTYNEQARGEALNIMSKVFDEMALELIHNGSLCTYVSSSSKMMMHK
jgi:hypothetical protein